MPTPTNGDGPSLARAFANLREIQRPPELVPQAFGRVVSLADGIVRVDGLDGVGQEELLKFPGDVYGLAFDLLVGQIGVVLLGDGSHLRAGDEVQRTGRMADVPVTDALLGRVIDPLGRPLDGGAAIQSDERRVLESDAPAIADRLPVTVPLHTGLKVVDALVPIGRGQRELILGDRQTGKTSVALDAIANQRETGVVCIYCTIGQRGASVARAIAALGEKNALANTIVMVAAGEDAPGLRYIAPYAATAVAEDFMARGRDVLIVYDDLTNHARAYREISLLLRRPPGREAFPGDIFYLHARLLERATRLQQELGGGSLTALPIVETEEQDLAAYIPTNLISITDGQLYLSPTLFARGTLPAVDVGKSVSRIGGKAQLGGIRELAGDLKLAYAQFEELEAFTRFGARLETGTRESIDHGLRIRKVLGQGRFDPLSPIEQLAVLLALKNGVLAPVPLERISEAELVIRTTATQLPNEAKTLLLAGGEPGAKGREQLLAALKQALTSFAVAP